MEESYIKIKREKEKQTAGCMIERYCRGNHNTEKGNLCEDCSRLLEYVNVRTDRCPFMETKTFCSACSVHCYSKEMRVKIQEVMRYAGPRMIFSHPVLAFLHVRSTLRQKRRKK